MRVAIYGGSFDPPHVGHAMVAGWLAWTERVDEIWLVPTRSHPFGKVSRPFDFRLALCGALASAVGPRVRVSDVERELPTPSYSVHTLDTLARRHPEHRFRLVVGSDNFAARRQWHAWERLEAEYPPIWVGRLGYELPEDDTVVFPDVSSTTVRRRLAEGLSVDHLVPREVLCRMGEAYRDGPRPTTP